MQSRFSPKLVACIIVAVFVGVALYLRTALPYDQIFVGEWIKFAGNDAYYQMHIVDNLVHNFPHFSSFDPYLIYPDGSGVSDFAFFNYLLAGIIWLVGLGSPTQHAVDVVGVYFPAVLGAMTVIPVYFIGKAVFNRWAGVIAAGLITITPSEFLRRSILGFTDYHVAETLFTTVAMLFLILAVKSAKQRELTFTHIKHRDWTIITKPLIYSLFAGLFLGIYLLTWQGALLFVFVIFVYLIIQFIIDHMRSQNTDYLCFISVSIFLVALIIFIPLFHHRIHLVSLVIALVVLGVLSASSRLMASRKLKPVYYPSFVCGLGLAGMALFYAVNPDLLSSMIAMFSIFAPTGAYLTILEMQPILFPNGDFSLVQIWGNFTTGFFLSLISLGILISLVIKRGEADKTLLVIWSLVMLAATLGQHRFAYYFAVNVALLTSYLSLLFLFVIRFISDYFRNRPTSYLSWQSVECPDVGKLLTKPVSTPEIVKRKRGKRKMGKEATGSTTSRLNVFLAVIAIFLLIFFPNIGPAIRAAGAVPFAPSDEWYRSLDWLRENTPDPFGDPEFYYQLHERPFHYPETAYGVAAWWDYGYRISRISHRIPGANPGQAGASEMARFFVSQDEEAADEIRDQLGSKYIIIDYATSTGAFYAVAKWAGISANEFFELYHMRQQGKLEPIYLFYPEYYRALSTRLYNFNGEAVVPENPLVISYSDRTDERGRPYKEITEAKFFPSYEEALDYISKQESTNYRLAGDDPFISPVPLESLRYYKLVYSSESLTMVPEVGMLPSVKIFEYAKQE